MELEKLYPWSLEAFAGRLEEALDDRNLKDLGIATTIAPQTLSNITAARHKPNLLKIPAMAAWLGVSAGWLTFGEGPKSRQLAARLEPLGRQIESTPGLLELIEAFLCTTPEQRQAILTIARNSPRVQPAQPQPAPAVQDPPGEYDHEKAERTKLAKILEDLGDGMAKVAMLVQGPDASIPEKKRAGLASVKLLYPINNLWVALGLAARDVIPDRPIPDAMPADLAASTEQPPPPLRDLSPNEPIPPRQSPESIAALLEELDRAIADVALIAQDPREENPIGKRAARIYAQLLRQARLLAASVKADPAAPKVSAAPRKKVPDGTPLRRP